MKYRIAFLLLSFVMSIDCFAQDIKQDSIDITFAIVIPKEKSLDAEQRVEIKNKLELVLARLQCAGAIEKTPFVIVPEINIIETSVTVGAKETFVLLEGELVLVAKNRYDGTAYNEVTIPLKRMVKETSVKSPKSDLIQEINPKDKHFTRFIRNTQRRIVEHYSGSAVEVP